MTLSLSNRINVLKEYETIQRVYLQNQTIDSIEFKILIKALNQTIIERLELELENKQNN